MSSKKDQPKHRRGRLEQLDRLIPLVGLGILAYFASRAAAERRTSDRHIAGLEGAIAEIRNRSSQTEDAPPARRSLRERFGRTKQFLVLAMLVSLIAYLLGGSTFASFSAETGNPASAISAGTLTLSDQVNTALATGTVCNSYGSASQDNYNPACSSILSLTNQAPGAVDTANSYPGGYATVVVKNTGSINASLFSFYAPYVNGVLSTSVSSGALVGTGQTVTGFTVSSLEGPVSTNDKIVLNYGATNQEFCAGGNVSPVASTTLSAAITTAGQTAITVTSGTNFNNGDTVVIDAEAMTIVSGGGTTSWTVSRGANGTTAVTHANSAAVREASPSKVTIPISGGYSVAAGTSNACPGTSAPIAAGTTFGVGTRLADTSTDSSPSNTDCYDVPTVLPPAGFTGATKGTDLNFNPTTGNPFCSAALLWVQEQSVVGGNTYNYCWFGRGSAQSTEGGSTEDAAGQCRTPTQLVLTTNASTSAATTTQLSAAITTAGQTAISVSSGTGFSNGDTVVIDNEEMTISSGGGTTSWVVTRGVNGTTAVTHSNNATVTKTQTLSLTYSGGGASLHGNIKTNDQITLAENGSTETCYATGNSYIGATAAVGVTGCYGAPSTTFDGSAVVKDTTAFSILNGTNSTSTISNFDTAHNAGTGGSGTPIYMAPLTGNGTANTGSTVQLAAHGDANSKDIRTFYVGVYFPAASGNSQNALQGLLSTFGLTFHIDQ